MNVAPILTPGGAVMYYSLAIVERSHRYWEGLHENLRLAPAVYAGWRVRAAIDR